MRRTVVTPRRGTGWMLAGLFALLAAGPRAAAAQTTTGTIRGVVTNAAGAGLEGATVSARNLEMSVPRGALSNAAGFYNLAGLRPGQYELTARRIGFAPRTRTVQLLLGQTIEINFSLADTTIALQAVTITAAAGSETRTPEVATNITPQQIEDLPQSNRNFLAFATQAPGMRTDANGNIAGGAMSADNINVFIDGASFKSDILPGGVVGQDPGNRNPAGNPFPLGAVQEFRVITQNFKAEYQKAASAIIVATTKTGGNVWSGNVFGFSQPKNFSGANYFERQAGQRPPDFTRLQAGGALGGPIIKDRLHVFGSYELNHQDRFNTVRAGRRTDDVPQRILDLQGRFTAPFRSDLYFGKLTYQPSATQTFELSGNVRDETDVRDFGNVISRQGATQLNNQVKTGIFKYQYAGSRFLSESQMSFQRYRYNPVSLTRGGVTQEFVDVLTVGPRDSEQDLMQDRLAFRTDLTTTVSGLGGTHVFKGGANADFLKYDVTKSLLGNAHFWYFGQFDTPAFARVGIGDPHLDARNRQIGLYVQDDWSVGRKLELNLGVRWDYESNATNTGYVTPDSVRAILVDADKKPLVDEDRYFANGSNRKPFYGAVQPRVGFSYDVFGTGGTTVFGGTGLYYDRNAFNNVLDERYRLQYVEYTFLFKEFPGDNRAGRIDFQPSYLSTSALRALVASGSGARPRIHLTANDTRLPRSWQTSFGVRQQLGSRYLATVSYGGMRGSHGFVFIPLRDAQGNIVGGPGFEQVLLSSDAAKTWYDALYVKLEKPLVQQAKWGFQLSYTLSKSTVSGTDESQGNYNYDVLNENSFDKHPSDGDERHHVAANWVRVLPWDIRFSGLVALGSGTPFDVITGCPNTRAVVEQRRTTDPTFEQFCVDKGYYGNGDFTDINDYAPGTGRNSGRPPRSPFVVGRWAMRNVDLRLAKRFAVQDRGVEVIGEVFNAFGFDNFRYNRRNLRYDQTSAPIDANSAQRTTYQLGARVSF